MASYRGYYVLDSPEPDRADSAQDEYRRQILELNTKMGTRSVLAPEVADSLRREITWACFSRAEVYTLRNFIAARNGRGYAFWIQTWEQDFELDHDHSASSSSLVVTYRGYSDLVFPQGLYRRHLAVRPPGGAFSYRKVTDAVDNGDGTETLTLESAIADALPAVGTLLSMLRLVRLDTDEPRIVWSGGHYAVCQLPTVELPREVPQ